MNPKHIPLQEGGFYHIYNRGNNKENLFFSKDNYTYFLIKYDEYLSDYLETYAYCLLPNHFHLLVSVKEQSKDSTFSVKVPPFKKVEPLDTQKKVEPLETEKPEALEKIISKQFRKFFTSYSMSINKQEGRTGSLFQKNFKRIKINNTRYLTNLVFYIHANPQLHGITDDFRMYPWSSYQRILINKPSKLKKENVLEWFNDKENYLYYHTQKTQINTIKHLIMED